MQTFIRFSKQWLPLILLIWLVGCVNTATLKPDYTRFGEAYADASNTQLLLNLARLANDDPVNFLQLGSFSSQYQIGAGLGFQPQGTISHPTYYTSSTTTPVGTTPGTAANSVVHAVSEFTQSAMTFAGNASLNVNETPLYQYFPLTGSNIVEAAMTPMSQNVFFQLYDQGYPADIVARTTVASIEWEHVTTNHVATYIYNYTITNTNLFTNVLQFLQTCAPTNLMPASNNSMVIYGPIDSNTMAFISQYIQPTNDLTIQLCKVIINTNFIPLGVSNLLVSQSFRNYISRDLASGTLTVDAINANPVSVAYITNALHANATYVTTNYEFYVNSPEDETYTKFLLFCEKLREAQLTHFVTVGPAAQSGDLLYLVPNPTNTNTSLKLTDVVSAVQANLSVKWSTNDNQFTVQKASQTSSEFVASTNITDPDDVIRSLRRDLPLFDTNDLNTSSVYAGDSETGVAAKDEAAALAVQFLAKTNPFTLKMRTFEAAMYTVAREEGRYIDMEQSKVNTNIPGIVTIPIPRLITYNKTLYINSDQYLNATTGTNIQVEHFHIRYTLDGFSYTNAYLFFPVTKTRANFLILAFGVSTTGTGTNSVNAVLKIKYPGSGPDTAPEPAGTVETTGPDALFVVKFAPRYFRHGLSDLTDVSMPQTLSVPTFETTTNREETKRYGPDVSIEFQPWVTNVPSSELSAILLKDRAKTYPYNNVLFGHDEYGPWLEVSRGNSAFKVRPLMTIDIDPRETCPSMIGPTTNELVDVDYGNGCSRNYFVADPAGQNQNRQVFTILTYLFAQTAVSTQNLPVQQLIQVQ